MLRILNIYIDIRSCRIRNLKNSHHIAKTWTWVYEKGSFRRTFWKNCLSAPASQIIIISLCCSESKGHRYVKIKIRYFGNYRSTGGCYKEIQGGSYHPKNRHFILIFKVNVFHTNIIITHTTFIYIYTFLESSLNSKFLENHHWA